MSEAKPLEEDAAARPRRRQARGERRRIQLLDAAADLFCEVGYSAASTNAIARKAGVSPGTLYQFFPNKEAIAVELGEELTRQMRDAHGMVFTPENAALPLDAMLDAVLDPLIEFNACNPAFLALIHGSDVPGRMLDEHEVLHASLQERTVELLSLRNPEIPADQCAITATMAFTLFKAGLELAMAHEGAQREAYCQELKASVYRYLAPVIGVDAPSAARSSPEGAPTA